MSSKNIWTSLKHEKCSLLEKRTCFQKMHFKSSLFFFPHCQIVFNKKSNKREIIPSFKDVFNEEQESFFLCRIVPQVACRTPVWLLLISMTDTLPYVSDCKENIRAQNKCCIWTHTICDIMSQHHSFKGFMTPKVSLKTLKADYLEPIGSFKEPPKCCLSYVVSRFWNTATTSHTYQIQHCFHYVSIADLADLNETGEHCEFRLDIPDGNRGVYHPGR